jgi:hypothetical protein
MMKKVQGFTPSKKWFYRFSGVLCTLCFWTISHVNAATYYVATTGNNSANGGFSQPFAALQKAHDVAAAGDTVFIRGGTYNASASITKSGTSDAKRICFWAYPGEKPFFDFSNGGGAISVTGSWVHVKGLELNKGGITVENAHDDILELMNCHHCNGTGIAIAHGTGGHLVLNCDSHDNYDAISKDAPGENADGFGIHYQVSGATTVIRGCRAWWNSDDGYDFISQEVPVTIENSWAMGAGYINYGTGTAGNGNGFKIGSSKSGIRHIIRNCVAWKNRASGFYANHSSGGNDWYNNTAYNNGTQFNLLASTFAECKNVYQCNDDLRQDGVTLSGPKAHKMRNNIGYPNKNSYMNGVDTKNNTWDLNITPANKDFLSVTDPSLTVTGQALEKISPMMGPRQADGSLPNVDFLKLASGSAMINKGTDVGLPIVDGVPDLGAYEYGATTIAQAAFSKNIAVRTGLELKLFGLARNGKPGVDKGLSALYTVTGQRIYPNRSMNTGIYIEKLLTGGIR